MSVTNPAPSAITSWGVEAGIRSFTVSIPVRPADNDLAGIIVIAKAGTQEPVFPDDVFYRGAWSDLIVVNTDADNNVLLPSQAYTVKVAAFDEFGTQSLIFSDAIITTTLQVVEDDLADGAVTNPKIPDNEIESGKIVSLIADKISAGTITGSTLQTAISGQRFVVSTVEGEAYFYDDDENLLASIGLSNLGTVGNPDLIIGLFGNKDTYDQYANRTGVKGYGSAVGVNGEGLSSGVKGEGKSATSTGVIGKGYFAGVYGEGSTTTSFGIYGFGNKCGAAKFVNADTTATKRNDNTTLLVQNNAETSYSSLVKIQSYVKYGSPTGLEISVNPTYGDQKTIKTSGGDADLSGGIVYFKEYTVSELPSASTAGGMIYVSNETGGAVMAFSDGTNWRRVTDRAIVS